MSSVEKKTFATEAAEVMEPNNAKVEIVNVGGNRVMKIAAQPGWVWSKDIKPLVGTESCQAKHLGVIVELSLIHISEPTRLRRISYAVFCLKKKK